MRQITNVIVGVVASLVISALIFVGLYKLFDQTTKRWRIFTAIIGAFVGVFIMLSLNNSAVVSNDFEVLTNLGSVEIATPAATIWGLVGGVGGAVVGFLLGSVWTPSMARRRGIADKSRPIIFVGPALLFLLITLVGPAVRTMYLSLRGNRADEGFVGLANYKWVFTNRTIFNLDGFGDIFTSGLFIVGLVAIGLGIVFALRSGRRIGTPVSFSDSTSFLPVALGVVLALFAVFSTLRGVVWNNLWWVVAVTGLSTGFGLLIAVLADRTRGETAAKALIFMPMAISFVGASVIWKFVYDRRPPGETQIGILNALIIGDTGRTAFLGGIVLLVAGLIAYALARSRNIPAALAPVGAVAAVVGVVLVGYVVIDAIFGSSTGSGRDPVEFLQRGPWNNFFLMLIMIWIQTGFAMVILSAAIKAVPEDMIEAAYVDGASASQVFWKVTLPSIRTTLAVVVTTIVVLVLKVYDIVKVMTNGRFDTNVIANEMYNQNFTFGQGGFAAALATVLFLSVLPVMIYNVRRSRA